MENEHWRKVTFCEMKFYFLCLLYYLVAWYHTHRHKPCYYWHEISLGLKTFFQIFHYQLIIIQYQWNSLLSCHPAENAYKWYFHIENQDYCHMKQDLVWNACAEVKLGKTLKVQKRHLTDLLLLSSLMLEDVFGGRYLRGSWVMIDRSGLEISWNKIWCSSSTDVSWSFLKYSTFCGPALQCAVTPT